MKKINVLLVSPFPPPYGGIANYGKNLFKALKAKGIQVRKYDTSRYDKYRFHSPDNKRNHIRIFNPLNIIFLFFISLDFLNFLFHMLKKRNLIIHIHTCSFFGWWRSIIYILIAKLFCHSTILHVHNAIDRFYFEESGSVQKYFIRSSLKIPEHIISLSKGIKELLSKLTSKPITPIYNGVDVNRFNLQKDYNKPIKLLFAGHVGHTKGVVDLLNAVKISGLESNLVQLTFMGRGDIDLMKELSIKLNIENQVKFTGHVSEDEKIKLFKSHHILALPSYGEGQPAVIFEGMASGMAIISSTVGSIPEVVKKENGILVEPGNIEELSEALKRMLLNIDIKIMGERNRQVAQKRYSFDRVVEDNILVYEKLNNKYPPS